MISILLCIYAFMCIYVYKKILKDVKVIPGEEIFTQHKLVVCDLNIRIEREKKKPHIPKLKVWKLREAEARGICVLC